MIAIETKKLTKIYDKHIVGIEDLNLEIKKGEVFGFIGPNGAGKSTAIRTLLNLIYKTSGEAKILGLDIEKDSTEIKKIVGYLPSEVNYYEDLTVRELLRYSASFYNINADKRIEELAKKLDLDLNRKAVKLSLGNKKKVGIIDSLLHNPKILILDEPTSGLDPLIQIQFFNILKEEKEKGTTIFFSSHILSEVKKICDRVGIIKQGKIIKVENVKDISNTNYKKVTIHSNNSEKIKFDSKNETILEKTKNSVTMYYSGNINILINKISKINIDNIIIEDLDLEEIFMHYYE